MKTHSIVTGVCLLSMTSALDFSLYKAGPGVEPAFKDYLYQIYLNAENLTATTSFTNLFTPDGRLTVLTRSEQGADAILKFKQDLLPPHGNKTWNHKPNYTTVYQDTTQMKVFQVDGVIDTTYSGKGGNCSAAYYTSHFSVQKINDVVQLFPHKMNLIEYNDFVVNPSYTPTSIPCTPPP